jgi:hypothetical protein
MGTLDTTSGVTTKRFSKILDIDGLTRPQTKSALDNFLNKGWRLNAIYQEGGKNRAILVREAE